MNPHPFARVAVLATLLHTGILPLATPGPHPSVAPSVPPGPQMARLPLRFEPNRGQAPAGTDFIVRGAGFAALLDGRGFALVSGDAPRVRVGFHDARMDARGRGDTPLAGITNYFRGTDASGWVREVPGFGRVIYERVYDGVDVVYYGRDRELEFDFVVAPHADPGRIALACANARNVAITRGGSLQLDLGGRQYVLHAPVAYQERSGERTPVEARYRLLADGRVGFELGAYDRARPLVIDPVLQYATFFGGNGDDEVTDIAVDDEGNAYVTGRTTSTNLHTSPGAFDSTGGGFDPGDAFVAKIDSTGSTLIFGTYLGGSGLEAGTSIDVDPRGHAYVTGPTNSADFPLANALQPAYGGNGDLFVAKLESDGSGLVYSTYLGGSDIERADSEQDQPAIAVGPSGAVFVAGGTQSNDFPTTPGAFSTAGPAPFVAKINLAGSALDYSTFLGGNTFVFTWDVEVDVFGQAHVVGFTGNPNLPTTPGVVQPVKANVEDQFVYKVGANGDSLVWCTYLGGSSDDFAYAVALDDSGNVYVAGNTLSTDYPVGSPPASNGASLLKLNPSASQIQYGLILGGDVAYGVDVDKLGRASVTGDGPGSPPDRDVFFSFVNASGAFNDHETFWGGLFRDIGRGVAVDPQGNAYVGGVTSSSTFPGEFVANTNPLQSSISTVPDGFVAHIEREDPVVATTRAAAVTTVINAHILGDPLEPGTVAYAPADPLPAGTTLEDGYAGRFVTTLSSAAWLVWIDRDFIADFAHPTRYALVDCVSGSVLLVADGEFWPVLNGAPYAGTGQERVLANPDVVYVSPTLGAVVPAPQAAPRAVARPRVPQTTPAGTDSWAIVVSGDATATHNYRKATVDSAVAVFRTSFGIPADQVRVFDNPNRRALLDSINAVPDGCPKLYFFFTGHGRPGRLFSGGDSTSAADLAGALARQNAGEYCTVWNQCFSGSFLPALNDSGVKGLHVTSTRPDTQSYRQPSVSARAPFIGNMFAHFILEAWRSGKRGIEAHDCATDSTLTLLDWWRKQGAVLAPQDPKNSQVFVFDGPGDFTEICAGPKTKSVCISWNSTDPTNCANASIYCQLVPSPGDTTFKLTKFWNWSADSTRYFDPKADPIGTGKYRFVSHANSHPFGGTIVYQTDTTRTSPSSTSAYPAAALGAPAADDGFGDFVGNSTALLAPGLDLSTVSHRIGQTPGGSAVLTMRMPLVPDPLRPWIYANRDPQQGYDGGTFLQLHAADLRDELGAATTDLPVRVDFVQGSNVQTFYAEAVEFGGEVFIDPVFLPAGFDPDTFDLVVNVEEAPALQGAPRMGSFELDAAILLLELSPTVDVPGPPGTVATLRLLAPVPNPARGDVMLRFVLPASDRVRLAVYDVHGRRVRTLVDGAVPAGTHAVWWDGRDAVGARVAAGVYFARVETSTERATRKIARIE